MQSGDRWDLSPAAMQGSGGVTARGSSPSLLFRLSARGGGLFNADGRDIIITNERQFDLKAMSLLALWKDNAQVLVGRVGATGEEVRQNPDRQAALSHPV